MFVVCKMRSRVSQAGPHNTIKKNLELLSLLLPPHKCWDRGHSPPNPVLVGARGQTQGFVRVPAEHPTNCAVFEAQLFSSERLNCHQKMNQQCLK